jgi:asparagine synthase (glutamine-hydrolysing)
MSGICGIAGDFAGYEDARRDTSRMLSALQSRGPDGTFLHVDPEGRAILGIASLDTGSGDPLPRVLTNEIGDITLVCDGQVFNADELTSFLRGRGHSLRSQDPCELLIHLYEEEGAAGLRRADGQFAFALWDGRKRKLVLGRDFLGVRPLYYHIGRAGLIAASEIKALLQHPAVPCGVDEVGVSHYLTFLSVPGPRTLFEGISKLPPGSVLEFADGRADLSRYWDLLDDPIAERDDESFYVERVRELHSRSLQRRSVEGPIGALLSGGNDSSANAVLMARQGCHPLHTFTVGLADVEGQTQYNDLVYAREVARLIESHHHEKLLSTEEFIETIPVMVDAMDDMVSEPSSVFLYHALRMAKEQDIRVVITGEANDELSCGHGEMVRIRDRYYKRWQPFMQKPAWLRRVIANMAPLLSPNRREVMQRVAAGDEYFWNFEIAWMDADKTEIMSASAWERCITQGAGSVVKENAARLRATDHGKRDYMSYIVYAMMQDYYFGNLMLGKLDLLSAHLGIESRCPYTEPEYAHFVYNIPAKFKAKDGLIKYFFKKAIEGVLPDEIIYRPKQGFRTPVVELFQGSLGKWAQPVLLDGGLTRDGLLRRDSLNLLLNAHREGKRDYSNRLWTAMALNLWHDRWVATRPRPLDPPIDLKIEHGAGGEAPLAVR